MIPRFILDAVGFPMIWVESICMYMHWMPLTKIQVECLVPVATTWYAEAVAANPAEPMLEVGPENYWRAFVTGLRPDEARAIAGWCGLEFAVPTRDQWRSAFAELGDRPEIEVSDLAEFGVGGSVLTLVEAVDLALGPIRGRGPRMTLVDQMLMRRGVMEWVHCRGPRGAWGAFGQPDPRFHATTYNPSSPEPVYPNDLAGRRLPTHGARLVRPAP